MISAHLTISGIRALKDNYIWMIRKNDSDCTIIVDPGDAAPVIAALEKNHLKLTGILVTHHHWDHTNGVVELQNKYNIPVFWSKDRKPDSDEEIIFPELALKFRVLHIPGHTLDHVAYYEPEQGVLFCGDTLFTAGCGRIFEGTPLQMYDSLMKVSNSAEDTRLYCGHEYTQSNLRFASLVEPENLDTAERIRSTDILRAQDLPTVPSILSEEKKTNPFLRCHVDSVKKSVENHLGEKISDPVKVFEVLREWKNGVI